MTRDEVLQATSDPGLGSGPLAFRVDTALDRDGFLERIRDLAAAVGVPVQALRADRVLSEVHLLMAARHATRASRGGRARASDPAVEFLLYAAADRQIHRAVAALGLAPGAVGHALVVFLGPVSARDARDALAEAGMADAAEWPDPRDDAPLAEAASWWHDRLAVKGRVEDALLARMALLALDKA